MKKYIGQIRLLNFDFAKKEKNSPKSWALFFGNLIYESILFGIMVFMAAILAMTSIPYNNCINSEIMDLACWEYGKSPLRAIGTLTLFIVFLLLFLLTRTIVTNLIHSLTNRTNEKAAADYKRYRAEVEREAQKLAKIRASMTEAEWAAYEIQLDNKRLLEEIKNNQSKTGGTASRFIYGVIDD